MLINSTAWRHIAVPVMDSRDGFRISLSVDVARRSWDARRGGTVFIWCRFVLRVPDVLGVTIDYINFPIVTLSAEMSTCGNETLQHSA